MAEPWVRAALDLAVLASLTDGPLHGYAIGQALAARGFGLLKGGSLYPVLGRWRRPATSSPPGSRGRAGRATGVRADGGGRDRLERDLASWRDSARRDDDGHGGESGWLRQDH